MNDPDPAGWSAILRRVLVIFFLPWRRFRRHEEQKRNGLLELRAILISLVIALFCYVVALGFMGPFRDPDPDGPAPWFILAVCAGGLIGAYWVRRRRLDPAAPAASYRSGMFIGIGFSEIPALAGFALSLVIDETWIYLPGLGASLIAFAAIAPTDRNIERKELELRASGFAGSLRDLLAGPPRTS